MTGWVQLHKSTHRCSGHASLGGTKVAPGAVYALPLLLSVNACYCRDAAVAAAGQLRSGCAMDAGGGGCGYPPER